MKFFLVFILLIPISCTRMPNHMKTGYSMINSHYEEMKQKNNWEAYAIGGSFYGGDIKKLFSHLTIISDAFDIDECRKALIDGSRDFLKTINQNQNAPKHLNHYPFSYEDIKYSLAIDSKEGNLLGHAILVNGKISYSLNIGKYEPLKTMHRETYTEALEIVKSKSSSNPENSTPSPVTTQISNKNSELNRSEIFPPEDGILLPLQGTLIKGRYYSPKQVFSCQADDFGEGEYISQDGLLNCGACVGFYNFIGDFKKAEVLFIPGAGEKKLDENILMEIFDNYKKRILQKVGQAEDIKILQQEMIEEQTLFLAISIEKTPIVNPIDYEFGASTRSYLIFPEKDKIAILSNQKVTPLGKQHTPKSHIEKLKNEIVAFKETFEFGPTPSLEKSNTLDEK